MFDVVFEADNGKKYVFGNAGNTWFGMNIGNGIEVSLGKTQGFSQIGDTVVTQSIGGRSISVSGQVYGNIVERKNAMRSIFAPFTTGRLIFQKAYYMRVYVKASPTFSAVKNNGLFKMQLYAPFPFFSRIEEQAYLIGEVIPNFRFPVNYNVPHRFGTRTAARYTNVMNTGDVRIPFRVHIHSSGACTNVTVSNLKTFAFLKLKGTLNAGDSVEIYRDVDNVLRAELTSDGTVTDIISWVSEDSSLFELEVGDNLLSANDDEGGANLTVRFTFNPAVVALYET